MDEAEVVASIVAGDLATLAEVLDVHVAPLFSFCRSMLPEDEAADAVENTFVIARVKLDGLRAPDRLGAWLQTVARGECFRRLIARGELPPAFIGDVPDAVTPAGLRGKILKVCTDDTATARAHRMSVAHQAGQFGHDGFPKPVVIPKPGRKSGAATPGPVAGSGSKLILAVTGGVVTVAVVIALALALRSHPSHTTAAGQAGLGGVTVPTSASGSGTQPGESPTAHASLRASHASSAAAITPAAAPVTIASPTAAGSSPARSPSPRPTKPSPTPSGTLHLSTNYIALVSVLGRAATRTITITAVGGPIAQFSISISGPGGNLTVTPQSGSLAAGQELFITVTGHARTSFTATLTFSPGNEQLTVHVQAKRML